MRDTRHPLLWTDCVRRISKAAGSFGGFQHAIFFGLPAALRSHNTYGAISCTCRASHVPVQTPASYPLHASPKNWNSGGIRLLTLHSGSTCVSLRSTYLNSVKLSPMPYLLSILRPDSYLLSLLRPDSCSTRTKPLPVTREASTGGYFLLLMEYIAINIKTRAHLSSRSSANAAPSHLGADSSSDS